MPRELSQCRKWEQARRDRLKESFDKLGKLLPTYDPSLSLSKIDVLTKAADYIQELQTSEKTYLTSGSENKPKRAQIKKLYLRIGRLLDRNELLSRLLRQAKITIPTEHSEIRLMKAKKWSGRISAEKASELAKVESQKENNEKRAQSKIPRKKKIPVKVKTKNVAVERPPQKVTNPNLLTITNVRLVSSSICTTTTTTTNAGTTAVAVTKVPALPTQNPFPTGAIILTNNIPVIQPPTIINPPMLINAVPSNTFILVNNKKQVTSTTVETSKITITKTLPSIRPKNITISTYINKVPIPASRYANNYILLSNVPPDAKKPAKKVLKKRFKKANKENKVEIQVAVKRKLEFSKDDDASKQTKLDEGITENVAEKTNNKTEGDKKTDTLDHSIDKICKDKKVPEDNQNEKDVKPEAEQTVSKTEVVKRPIEEPEKPVQQEKLPEEPPVLDHSELSNDIFASLQVPAGSQNPESTSPTAAFLNAFPLVSSFTGVKVAEVMEEETSESRHTPTLLQIGTMDVTKPTQTESLTPSLLNLDNFSTFFSSKDICTNLYSSFENIVPATTVATVADKPKTAPEISKPVYQNAVAENDCLKIKAVVQKDKRVEASSSNNFVAPNMLNFYENNQSQPVTTQSVINSFNDQKTKIDKVVCSKYNTYTIPEYNTFNPFELPKTTYMPARTYNQPVYTNNTNCSYNYQTDFNNYSSMKPPAKNDKFYYENYDNNQYYYQNQNRNKYHIKSTKQSDVVPKPPVNWMTTPDLKQQNNDFLSVDFSTIYSQNSFNTNIQTTYFNTTAPMYSTDYQTFTEKKLDYQRNDTSEDHQITWSPTKLPQVLDPPHNFVATTLPTLVGDLALGNMHNYVDKSKQKCKERKPNQSGFDNTTNFLSVSQLVEHTNKDTNTAARITSRRNSGGRSKPVKMHHHKSKPNKVETKEASPIKMKTMQFNEANDWMDSKRIKSSYSTEALLGPTNQLSTENKQRLHQPNYTKSLPVSTFLPENLISYFPPVDIAPENNFNQQNHSYQNNTFQPSFPSSMQSNTYTSTFMPTPTTSYLQTTNFIPEISHDYNINENIFSHSKDNKQYKTQMKTQKVFNNTTPKKSKKKTTDSAPGLVDFNLFSMPGTINSPLLPDDFHAHTNFLPPPPPPPPPTAPNPNQIYPCKNSLYPKPPKQTADLSTNLLPLPPVTRSNVQYADIGSSLNLVGPSLTNFNLSTIFPEINKAPVPDVYLDSTKNKNYLQRSYLPPTSQFSKAPIYSSITTQSFGNS